MEEDNDEVYCGRVYQCYICRYMYSQLRDCRTPRVSHVCICVHMSAYFLALSNRERACIGAIRQYGTYVDGGADGRRARESPSIFT